MKNIVILSGALLVGCVSNDELEPTFEADMDSEIAFTAQGEDWRASGTSPFRVPGALSLKNQAYAACVKLGGKDMLWDLQIVGDNYDYDAHCFREVPDSERQGQVYKALTADNQQ